MSGIFRWGRPKTPSTPQDTTNSTAAAVNGPTSGPTATTPNPPAPAVTVDAAPAAPPTPQAPPLAPPAPLMPPSTTEAGFSSTMMDYQLTLQHTLNRAAQLFSQRAIVTNTPAGPVRTTYGAWARRVNQLAGALEHLGVTRGDRVATL
ncbi:MAG TPA: hypothetical protein VF916_02285, partial [Ktedonobacterales bacterium]